MSPCHVTSFGIASFGILLMFFQEGMQKKQINCVAQIRCDASKSCEYFATGNEDCTVEVFSLKSTEADKSEDTHEEDLTLILKYEKLETLSEHTSGVRALSFASPNDSSQVGVLISGGGKSEVFMTSILVGERRK